MDINNFGQMIKPMAQDPAKKEEGPMGVRVSQLAKNKSILESSVNISLSSGNDSLAFVFKSAIKAINEQLETVTGESDSLQAAFDAGIDVSPEATADRIVSMSTSFFSTYQDHHPELSDEEARESFIELIGQGIDQGFAEARDILSGLGVLTGDIAENIDKTYDLVEEGLLEFMENGEDFE